MKLRENTSAGEQRHPMEKISDEISAIREEVWDLREHLLDIFHQLHLVNFESLPKRFAGAELYRVKKIVSETNLKEIIPIVDAIRETLEKWYGDDLPSLYDAGLKAYHSTRPSE